MAKNPPPGPGRKGEVKKRIQAYNPVTKHWVKIDVEKHRIIDQKTSDHKKFKGVRRVQ
jgi:predicted P-loop ATPase/GTPase